MYGLVSAKFRQRFLNLGQTPYVTGIQVLEHCLGSAVSPTSANDLKRSSIRRQRRFDEAIPDSGYCRPDSMALRYQIETSPWTKVSARAS